MGFIVCKLVIVYKLYYMHTYAYTCTLTHEHTHDTHGMHMSVSVHSCRHKHTQQFVLDESVIVYLTGFYLHWGCTISYVSRVCRWHGCPKRFPDPAMLYLPVLKYVPKPHTWTQTCMPTYTHVHINVGACMCCYKLYVHTLKHTYTHACVHKHSTYMNSYIHTCMHSQTHLHYTYEFVHTSMYIRN